MKRHVYKILRRILKRHLISPARLIPRRKVSALYASSVERNELYCDVERAFQVQLDDAKLQQAETFGALADYVMRCLPEAPARLAA
jgi:acyl carrier protein